MNHFSRLWFGLSLGVDQQDIFDINERLAMASPTVLFIFFIWFFSFAKIWKVWTDDMGENIDHCRPWLWVGLVDQ